MIAGVGILGLLGFILLLAGMIWLIIVAIQTGETTAEKAIWAVVNFFCQPLSGIIFYVMKKQGLIPLIMVIVGWLILVLSGAAGGLMSVPETID